MATVSNDDDHKPFMFLGKDVSKIPCFRNSYFYGILGGIASGLGCFMLTSKPKKAVNVGFGSFFVISTSYWILCRYNYSITEKRMNELKDVIIEKKSGQL
ncbi:cytochrome c oxidase assembly protein COX20, mitochondrial [Daktulosphaira vitifoliae]|uniref:cytochrome c oxidase assembly protein COX20, mitochondrial n=1 Tax=Daktulosphaira vitifoliae TaxID=58002 RepID=UPI0021AA0C9F|nr:cytochrome c oxidase assembly protein COX20, mitochondrial [Daktulosphaira vitifoliae]